jgi:pyruvate ferredoxin oxidoreductase beta subunit
VLERGLVGAPDIVMAGETLHAVECGILPLKKAVKGEVSYTQVKQFWRPVEEYLRGQGHFRHLFEPTRWDALIRDIQDHVDRYWAATRA